MPISIMIPVVVCVDVVVPVIEKNVDDYDDYT